MGIRINYIVTDLTCRIASSQINAIINKFT